MSQNYASSLALRRFFQRMNQKQRMNEPKAKNASITCFVVFTKLQTLFFGLEDSSTVHHHPPDFFNPKQNSNLGFPCTQHHHTDDKNSQNVKVTNYSLVSACCSHTSDGHPPDSFLLLPSSIISFVHVVDPNARV